MIDPGVTQATHPVIRVRVKLVPCKTPRGKGGVGDRGDVLATCRGTGATDEPVSGKPVRQFNQMRHFVVIVPPSPL